MSCQNSAIRVAFNGDITVSGSVGGSVLALNGRVTLATGASVGGDVISSDPADVAEGATVGGQVSSDGLPTDFDHELVARVRVFGDPYADRFRSPGMFDPAAEPPADATPMDLFAHFVGRGLTVG